tara:strand:+ start:2240 stop:2776 length:537 start_codon:yes stop_codon:yes gene_type:complete
MNIINDEYAVVFPPRCGTRWTGGRLYDLGLLDSLPPQHWWDNGPKAGKIGDRKVLCNVRNPYTRVPSIYKWHLQIEEDVPTNIVDYILSDIFHQVKPCTKTYGEHQDKIYKYIKLENVRAEYQALLQVDLGEYSGEYIDTNFDDMIGVTWLRNDDCVRRINEWYKSDFDILGYEMIQL